MNFINLTKFSARRRVSRSLLLLLTAACWLGAFPASAQPEPVPPPGEKRPPETPSETPPKRPELVIPIPPVYNPEDETRPSAWPATTYAINLLCGAATNIILPAGTYTLRLDVSGSCTSELTYSSTVHPSPNLGGKFPPATRSWGSGIPFTVAPPDGQLTFTCAGNGEGCHLNAVVGPPYTPPAINVTPKALTNVIVSASETNKDTNTSAVASTMDLAKKRECGKEYTFNYQAGQQLFVISVADDSVCTPKIMGTDIPGLSAGQEFSPGTTYVQSIQVPVGGGSITIGCGGSTPDICDFNVSIQAKTPVANTPAAGAPGASAPVTPCGTEDTVILENPGQANLPAGWYTLMITPDPRGCDVSVSVTQNNGNVPFSGPATISAGGAGTIEFRLDGFGEAVVHLKCESNSNAATGCGYKWTLQASALKTPKTPKKTGAATPAPPGR